MLPANHKISQSKWLKQLVYYSLWKRIQRSRWPEALLTPPPIALLTQAASVDCCRAWAHFQTSGQTLLHALPGSERRDLPRESPADFLSLCPDLGPCCSLDQLSRIRSAQRELSAPAPAAQLPRGKPCRGRSPTYCAWVGRAGRAGWRGVFMVAELSSPCCGSYFL